ncbi:MAG: MBL fold metallo-hydrolase, partial [Halobacteria archaeon]|nr:MBL fold metallo-hydrolase [Halobacteria archaeon]
MSEPDLVEPVEGCDGIYVVDTVMLGAEKQTAAFVIDGGENGDTMVVDTGLANDVDNLLDALDEIGISTSNIDYITVTHVHLDHAGGLSILAEECEN